jgi:hypothetical protein
MRKRTWIKLGETNACPHNWGVLLLVSFVCWQMPWFLFWIPRLLVLQGGFGQLGTEFGLEGSNNMEGIVEMVTPSPYRVEMVTPPIYPFDEAQVDTGKGKFNNGTSDGTVVRRELTSVDLVSTPHRLLATRSLPFSGSSPGGIVKTCTSIFLQLSQGYCYQPSWKENHLSFQT